MTSGSFIKIRVDELEDKFAEYYNAYNDVRVYSNSHGTLILDRKDKDGDFYCTELTPYAMDLKQVVLDSYNFYFNDYIIVNKWVYFLEKDIEIKRRK